MPSPTLTDPDMILPVSQDTSPSRQTDDPSALPRWHHAPTADDGQMKSPVRNLLGNGHRLRHTSSEKALKMQETQDIRPLSKQSELSQRSAGSTLASSPLLHEEFGFKRTGDTRPPDGASDHWDTMDDGSVISESVSPLVDAERESYPMSENGGIDGYKFSDRFRKAIVEEDDEPYSHAAMSVRAEEILANAKKRLTEMESNLNRARHTINRPSSSMSSFNTTSDPQSMYTLPKNLSPSKHRQQNSPPSSSSSKGHSRVFSETSVPSSMQTSPPKREGHPDDVRSSSAIGSVGMDASTGAVPKQGSESRDWFWTGLTRNTSHGARLNNYGLQPLDEDGPPPLTFDSPERQQSPPLADNIAEFIPSNEHDLEDATTQYTSPSSTSLTRARSTNQMRDIRDQMQDLKGKISSLKQRAREDSLRRRSLQSLRTPTPFTAAEQWYTGASGYNRDRSRSRPREGSPPAIQPVIEEEAETKQYPVQTPEPEGQKIVELATNGSSRNEPVLEEPSLPTDGSIARDSNDSPKTAIDGFSTESDVTADQTGLEQPLMADQENGVEDGSGGGEQEMAESSALPIGGRHEDRPDAFDYEHLFLHSRMGTLGQGSRSRSSSHSSEYSVETTKPSRVSAEVGEVSSNGHTSLDESAMDQYSSDSRSSIHERKGSVESVSTVATFATATEGDGSASDADEEEWVYRRPMAGSWEPEYPGSHKLTAGKKNVPQPGNKGTKHTTQVTSQPLSTDTSAGSTPSPAEARIESQPSETATADLLAFLSSTLPSEDGASPRPIELSDSDRELAAKLVRSVAKVCVQLQAFSMEGNKYGGRPWRRRLDGARRVLDGETNGEVF
ncbi:MAG: hypothetical protein Q9201_002451 [Fulgogasparrea decipioides]